jgi:hypothetical protein
MDKMEHLIFKTKMAGWFGAVTAGGSWFGSDFVNGWLRTLLLFLGCVSAAVSIFYVRKINHHREIIKAMEQIEKETKFCRQCKDGLEPEVCPIEIEHRPPYCPKEIRKAKQKNRLSTWLKSHGLIFKDETTKT